MFILIEINLDNWEVVRMSWKRVVEVFSHNGCN